MRACHFGWTGQSAMMVDSCGPSLHAWMTSIRTSGWSLSMLVRPSRWMSLSLCMRCLVDRLRGPAPYRTAPISQIGCPGQLSVRMGPGLHENADMLQYLPLGHCKQSMALLSHRQSGTGRELHAGYTLLVHLHGFHSCSPRLDIPEADRPISRS